MSDMIPPGLTKGVAYTLGPPSDLHASIAGAVQRAIDAIPPDKHAAGILVATEKGANLVIAGRSSSGVLQAQAWVGKTGWDRPIREGLAFGGQVAVVF